MSREICADCNGIGVVYSRKGAYNRFELCDTCNGEGFIELFDSLG